MSTDYDTPPVCQWCFKRIPRTTDPLVPAQFCSPLHRRKMQAEQEHIRAERTQERVKARLARLGPGELRTGKLLRGEEVMAPEVLN